MPKTAQVTFGERSYTLSEKPMGAAGAWRERLRKSRAMLIFESLDTAMIQLVAAADGVDEGGWGNVDVNQVIGIVKILPVIVNGLANSVDEIEEMLFEYSAELAADREWLLENAYDTEAITAFLEVVKFAYPIWALLALVRGPAAARTPTNSHSTNGASGRREPSHRKKA